MNLEPLIVLSKIIVMPAVRGWLARDTREAERALPLAELIDRQVTDALRRRRAHREIDMLIDTVTERLRPLVATRFAALADNEMSAALDAVGDTFRAIELSDAEMFAVDLDPHKLADRMREAAPDLTTRAGLSPLAVRLYHEALAESCVCLTQLLVQLKPLQGRGIAELLERTSSIADKLDHVLARLPRQSIVDGSDVDAAFLGRYLSYLSTSLDLYDVDVRSYRPRTTLSVAYVSLAVQATGDIGRAAGRGWSRLSFRQGLIVDPTDAAQGAVRVEQALAANDRMLVRGEAGSGKTTLLHWVAVNAARGRLGGTLEDWNSCVPLIVKLRRHAGCQLPAPERFLNDIAPTIAGSMPVGWVHRCLESGRAVLLVDGVDEIPTGQRQIVRRWLGDLLASYPAVKVVVTARPAAAAQRWLTAEGFGTANLERMNPADLRALVRQWHEAVSEAGDLPCRQEDLPRYERKLLGWLEANPHVLGLATNPLLCAMLCALNLDRAANLPRDRMGIYHAAFEMLLDRRDAEREIRSDVPELIAEDKRQVLQNLAWQMSANGRIEVSRVRAEQWIGERLAAIPRIEADAVAVLDHLLNRSGVLREPVPDRFDFVHRTFQEYLAAREAADRRNDGTLGEKAHLDSWRETIIMAAGHGSAPFRDDLLTEILDRSDHEPAKRRALVLVAAACQETVPTIEPRLRTRIEAGLDALLPPRSKVEARTLSAIGDPLLRRMPTELDGLSDARAAAAVWTAAMVNGPHALDLLARYASDPRWRVQRALADAWEYFDADEYADRVLADAPLIGGQITVRRADLLRSVRRLRHLDSLHVSIFDGPINASDLAGVPALLSLHLGRLATPMGDIGWLAEHTGLRHLSLDCPTEGGIDALSALCELEYFELAEVTPTVDLRCLTDLPALVGLGLSLRVGESRNLDLVSGISQLVRLSVWAWPGVSVGSLRPLTGLRELMYWNCARPELGLDAIVDALPGLEWLWLPFSPWVFDLMPITRLANVRGLDLRDTNVTDLSPLAACSQLRFVLLGHCDRLPDLEPFAELDHLRDIIVEGVRGSVDLSPLAGRNVSVQLVEGSTAYRTENVRIVRKSSRYYGSSV